MSLIRWDIESRGEWSDGVCGVGSKRLVLTGLIGLGLEEDIFKKKE